MTDHKRSNMTNESRTGLKGMHFAMIACCVLMLVPIVGLLLAGGGQESSGLSLTATAPLLLCVGAHFVMHKMFGKNCHGKNKEAVDEQVSASGHETAGDIPLVKRG